MFVNPREAIKALYNTYTKACFYCRIKSCKISESHLLYEFGRISGFYGSCEWPVPWAGVGASPRARRLQIQLSARGLFMAAARDTDEK